MTSETEMHLDDKSKIMKDCLQWMHDVRLYGLDVVTAFAVAYHPRRYAWRYA